MTDISKATPERWHIVEYGDGDSLVIHSDSDNRVCFMATHGGSKKAWKIIQRNALRISRVPEMERLLEDVKQRCLFADDGGTIGVTEDPHVPAELFNRICALLTSLEDTIDE